MLVYKLNKNIDAGKLLNDIQNFVSKNADPNKEMLLTIRIQEISYSSDSYIPKIEYHNLDHSSVNNTISQINP